MKLEPNEVAIRYPQAKPLAAFCADPDKDSRTALASARVSGTDMVATDGHTIVEVPVPEGQRGEKAAGCGMSRLVPAAALRLISGKEGWVVVDLLSGALKVTLWLPGLGAHEIRLQDAADGKGFPNYTDALTNHRQAAKAVRFKVNPVFVERAMAFGDRITLEVPEDGPNGYVSTGIVFRSDEGASGVIMPLRTLE